MMERTLACLQAFYANGLSLPYYFPSMYNKPVHRRKI